MPPATTVSPSTVQSPDRAAWIAGCTVLPSRGPAARAFTLSRFVTPYDSALDSSSVTRSTDFTLSSSRRMPSNGASAAASDVTTVRFASGRRTRRPACLRSDAQRS